MNVSIVIPCYRSAATLPELIGRIEESLLALVSDGKVQDWEAILVVDGSPDAAAVVAESLARSHPNLRAVILRRNFGQHNALIAGIRAARFESLVTLDDDLQHPPEEIHKLLRALEDPTVDLAYGVAEVEEHGLMRSAASRFIKSSLALAGVSNARWVGAFRAFRTDLREAFENVNDPQPNLDVLLSWSTASVVPVRLTMNRRTTGRSTYSIPRLASHALNMVTGYGVIPLKLATWLGFGFGFLGIILLLVVLIRYILGETTVAGFTTTIALIALFSGAQMVTIGIIGEYLGRQHFRSMLKPMYLIREMNGSATDGRPEDV